MNDFQVKAKLTKGCSASFLMLIPKVPNPQSLTEYRLICLVGCMYKIFAKLLVARLNKVIGKLISVKQLAFIPSKNILYGVLEVNKNLYLTYREKRSCMVWNVDYKKAYDSVSWNYLRFCLDKIGFGSKRKKWMEVCMFSN